MKKLGLVVTWVALCAALAQSYTWVPGQLYVIFKPGTVGSLYRDSNGHIRCGLSYIDSVNSANSYSAFISASCGCPLMLDDYLVIFPESANIPALVDAYMADTSVLWAGQEARATPAFIPDDSFFSKPSPTARPSSYQWALDSAHLQMEKAWDITKGDSNVVIAILEGAGLAWRHPDLQPTVWINAGEDLNHNGTFDTANVSQGGDIDGVDNDGDGYVDNVTGYHFDFRNLPGGTGGVVCDPDPEPFRAPATAESYDYRHGAWVWSNAAAATNNNRGVAGVGFNCRVMPVAADIGPTRVPFANALCFLLQMKREHGVPHVVNMSFTNLPPGSRDNEFLDSLYRRGVILIAAAGNDGSMATNYPASHPKVVSVAATDSFDYRADFSTFDTTVDISAPGFNYMATHNDIGVDDSTLVNPDYRYASRDEISGVPLSGTSFSSPQAAGVAALVRSLFPDWSNSEIIAKLRTSSDPVQFHDADEESMLAGKMGTGRLNAFKAVTFFDSIPRVASDTTLSGTVYVSGDIIVPRGKTLTLAAGTKLKFIPGDVMGSSGNPSESKAQIIVKGTLTCLGSQTDSIILTSFQSSPQAGDWGGILIDSFGRANVGFTRISYADTGISVRGDTATVKVRNSTFTHFKSFAVYSRSNHVNLGILVNQNDCGRNNIFMKTAELPAAKALKQDGAGLLYARGNYWDSVPPPSGWFVGSVDYSYSFSQPATPGAACPDGGGGGGCEGGDALCLIAEQVDGTRPMKFDLSQNYPNPFNSATVIRFSLAQPSRVELRIYNVLGQVVRSMLDEKPAGVYEVLWDGRDEHGVPVSSGPYLYQIRAGNFIQTKKMQLVK